MKLLFKIFIFCLINLTSYAQLRIVCIGNSISQGNSFARPGGTYEYSYRPWLWQKLVSDGFNVDMVGYNPYFFNESAGNMTMNFPSTVGKPFDRDAEAYYGITSTGFVNGDSYTGWTGAPLPKFSDRINDPVKGYTPDIALMHIGTNDQDSTAALVEITKDNIREIIKVLRAKNPTIVVFLAKLITGWKKINPEIDPLCLELNTDESPVIAVDQTSGFINDPSASGAMTYDWVHPNAVGQKLMMKRWYEALISNLNDKIKPILENKLSASKITQHSIHLDWTFGTDNYGIKNYTLFINNTQLGNSLSFKTDSFNVSNLSPGTDYTFKLVAVDWNGNVSDTASVNVTIPVTTAVDIAQQFTGIEISPTAGSGIFTLKGASETSVSIVDFTGRQIIYFTADTEEKIIDLSNLSDGLYFVRFQKGDLFSSRKILIGR